MRSPRGGRLQPALLLAAATLAAHEYLRAVLTYDLTHRDVRELSRNSVEFAFLPSAGKAVLLGELDRRFAAFESGPAQAFQRLLPDTSEASRNASR